MDALLFHPKLTVAEVLEKDARVSKVFIRTKTACVGCYLARFCTLEDVAAAYDLELDEFIKQFQQAVQSNLLNIKKEQENEKMA